MIQQYLYHGRLSFKDTHTCHGQVTLVSPNRGVGSLLTFLQNFDCKIVIVTYHWLSKEIALNHTHNITVIPSVAFTGIF